MTHEEKLELVNYLIFLRGKLQSLSIQLLLLGEDPAPVDAAEEKLAAQIGKLRLNLMTAWQADAGQLMGELRGLNKRAQDRLRDLKTAQNRVSKLADILGFIDRGLGAVMGLLV